MKTSCLAVALILATLVFSGGVALAASKTTTVKGILSISPQGTAILKAAADSDKGYVFDPAAEAGKKILAVCQPGKVCIVRGKISGNQIINAYYVSIGQ